MSRTERDVTRALVALAGGLAGGDHNLRLTDLARSVVTRQLPGRLLLDHARARTTTRQS